MKKLYISLIIVLFGISINAKTNTYTLFNHVFQDCVSEHIHNAQDSIDKVKYDVWYIPMDSDYYITVLPDEFISFFKNDVSGIIHNKDIDLSTPLKKKIFERTAKYAEYDSLFHQIQGYIFNHTIHYWDKVNNNSNLSVYKQYDLNNGGFRFSFNPPFSTYVPAKFSHSFIKGNTTFFAKVENLDIATLIEDSYGNNNNFIICYLKGYTLKMSTDNSVYFTTSPSFYFELLDIQLIHMESKQVIWSIALGDLSNNINSDTLR